MNREGAGNILAVTKVVTGIKKTHMQSIRDITTIMCHMDHTSPYVRTLLIILLVIKSRDIDDICVFDKSI